MNMHRYVLLALVAWISALSFVSIDARAGTNPGATAAPPSAAGTVHESDTVSDSDDDDEDGDDDDNNGGCTCPGDGNCDGRVDFGDIASMLENFAQTCPDDHDPDDDGDDDEGDDDSRTDSSDDDDDEDGDDEDGCRCPGDADCDGDVDFFDIKVILAWWMTECPDNHDDEDDDD